ncbi:MAG TPA: hypothetical protein PLP21_00820 [Pyrinomonadaceae bacterium]|nr:hypothetical protein [Acidobacteriota bacterium]HQZ94823.1 hypothetical protein [Pyrinomonadaceae bacterium]
MKIFVSTLIIVSAAGAAMAQEPAAKAPVEATKAYAEAAQVYNLQAKVVAELASAQGFGIQKNSPLQADEVNESVQTLADGNRIVRSSTSKFWRNSEGRIRREGKSAFGNVFGTTFSFGDGVSISNPVQGQKYVLDSDLKTARVIEMPAGQKSITIAGSKLGEAEMAEVRKAKVLATTATKLNGELKVGVPLSIQTVPAIAAQGISVQGEPLVLSKAGGPKYETRTEELGTRDFEGVSAEGTRRTTTIPAGAIGNERPIEIVYERWYSKEIGMVVYSKNTDPRSGEQTYKLTNIVRSEPDPSLFAVPTEYKKVSENGTVYRVTSPAAAGKAPTAPKTVMVSSPAKAGKP